MDRSRHYLFLRGLELEGSWPHDVGCWPITVRRIEAGWGVPHSADCPPIELSADKPLPPVPSIDPAKLKPNRIDFYYRLRNSSEIIVFMQKRPAASVGLEIFPQWGITNTGRIKNQPVGAQPTGSHMVILAQYDSQSQEFLFPNSWGNSWGDKGLGYIHADYIDRWMIESWGYALNQGSPRYTTNTTKDLLVRHSSVATATGKTGTSVELYDTARDERIGWSCLVRTERYYDIEELYVRPEYRGAGYGRQLAAYIRDFVVSQGLVPRLWVPFADTIKENPSNREPLLRTVRHLGLRFVKSPKRWAAYLAIQGGESGSPIEPEHFPQRVRSTKHEQLHEYILTKNAELYRRLA